MRTNDDEQKNYLIQITNLRHVYPKGVVALHDITLNIEKGDCVAILGPNGSGKTTLLLHMNGILLPAKGKVLVNGFSTMDSRQLPHIRKAVGFVFQDPNDQLFMPSVIEDVAFGPLNQGYSKEEAVRKATDSLKLVGLNGIDKRNPAFLSFGQKKRVAIAGILAMDCPILVFDEPTSNLDPPGKKAVLDIIQDLNNNGRTIVFATHDVEVAAQIASRCVLLKQGKQVKVGAAADILTDSGLLHEIGMPEPVSVRLAKVLGLKKPYPLTASGIIQRLAS
ncbi:MAG: energy-coupling factor ABC transporter ATP-binding protein [Candidatus Ranarchaeia archaeon]